MDMERVDYAELQSRCMVTDVLIVDGLLFAYILLVLLVSNIWFAGITGIGVLCLLAVYHYKIKISRYLDFLDEDTPDPEI